MIEGHWANTCEHAAITTENRAAFATSMEKFGTERDAAVGYMQLQQTAGKPFKLPESMDNLENDAQRTELTGLMQKLSGSTPAGNIEALAGLNLKAGMAEGTPVDEAFAGSFKQFVVDGGFSESQAQKMIAWFNPTLDKIGVGMAAKREADMLAKATTTNEALVAYFKGEDNVKVKSDQLRAAIQNHPGMTAEKYEKIGDAIADSVLTKDPDAAIVFLEMIAPLGATAQAADGGGGGGGGNTGGDPIDPDTGCPTHLAAGLCTVEENEAWKVRQARPMKTV